MDDEMEGVVIDTPWGDLIIVPCSMPDSPNERWDMPTARWCSMHNRTIYYCDELRRFWCDGGPPDFKYHAFKLVPLSAE